MTPRPARSRLAFSRAARTALAALAACLFGCGAGPDDDVTFSGPRTPSPDFDAGYEGRTLDAWVALLEAKDAADRYAALVALAELPEATAHLPAIEARLADAAPTVRWAALECLGRIGEPAAASAGASAARTRRQSASSGTPVTRTRTVAPSGNCRSWFASSSPDGGLALRAAIAVPSGQRASITYDSAASPRNVNVPSAPVTARSHGVPHAVGREAPVPSR